MRLRVRLKSLSVLALLSLSIIVYNFIGFHMGGWNDVSNKPRGRVARITADDLIAIGHRSSPVIVTAPNRIPVVSVASLNSTFNATTAQRNNLAGNGTPCNSACQSRRLKQRSGSETADNSANVMNTTRYGKNQGDSSMQRRNRVQQLKQWHDSAEVKYSKGWKACDRMCRLANLKQHRTHRGGAYASRVQVESMTLPNSWTVTQDLVDRLSARRSHVQEACNKYGLDKPSETNKPNAWEFLISEKYGLVWCNVFKAASSTWFYNFNILAGFSEKELLQAKDTPIHLARKRYNRPTVEELQKVMNSTNPPLSFMIVRHPLKRLVSGYRDKILSGNRYYSKLVRTIVKRNPGMGIQKTKDQAKSASLFGNKAPQTMVPSFPQFVQFLLDETAKGAKLDEHWVPMNDFCTPCLVPFDVFAKVETLEEDGNYIIFSAGIEDLIKPKRINRSRNEPTDEVADKFLCQLSQKQMEGLLELYKYDLELFEYDASKYIECTLSST
ncbi:carbohydrate sulfotransferase 11-like [Panulirus ornatus]|uniref:carbohydrate sulfotransferase 11-like n=1 Tax=Panulirus ornatus TaxID=150431 RepID=UPI003A83BA25